MKTKVFYQLNDHDCGLAALKSMLYYYSNGNNLIKEEDLNHEEYSFYDLKEIAKKNDMEVKGVEVMNIAELKPSIIQVKYNEITHFLFFLKIKNNYVYVIDPSYGKRKIKRDYFENIFLKKALIFEDIKINKKHHSFSFDSFFAICFEFIFYLPFFFFLFEILITKYIHMFTIALILLSFIIKKFLLLIRMNSYDKKIENILKQDELQEEYIKKLYLYKKAKFSFPSSFYSFILFNFSFFLFTLLLKGGYLIALFYLIYLLYKIYELKNTLNHIYLMGDYFQITTNQYQKYKNANNLANKFILKRETLKTIFSVFLIILTFLLNHFLWQSNELVLSLCLFEIYLLQKDDLYEFQRMYKQIEIGKTIYRNLRK